jgi:hypothetical protein
MPSHVISRALSAGCRLPALLGALAALTTLAATGTAAADPNWSYAAPAECPAQAAFADAVAKRGASLNELGGRTLTIALAGEGAQYIGTLKLKHETEPETERKVQGATCEEVADALAVVTAITIRGSEGVEPGVAVPAKKSKVDASRMIATDDMLNKTLKIGSEDIKFSSQINATAYLGQMITSFASPLSKFELQLSFARFVSLPDGQTVRTGPILRTSVSFLKSLGEGLQADQTTSDNGSKTSTVGFLADISVCGSPKYDTKGFVLLGCAGFGAGVISFKTQGPNARPAAEIQPLALASIGAEVKYNFTEHFHVAGKFDLGLALGSPRATRIDGSAFANSGPVVGSISLGLGVSF